MTVSKPISELNKQQKAAKSDISYVKSRKLKNTFPDVYADEQTWLPNLEGIAYFGRYE